MNKLAYAFIFTLVFGLAAQTVYADNIFFDIKTNLTENSINNENNSCFKDSYLTAIEKFKNGNVTAGYEDFKTLIENNKGQDFYLILIALKTSEFGMYDLTENAFQSMKDKLITSVYEDNIKRYYFSKNNVKKEDILYLSEAYSNIFYNNLMLETISELKKKPDMLTHYDYANYLMALAYYKLDNIPMAQKYITVARVQNSENISYKCLQTLILAKTTSKNEALKLINEVKKENISINELNSKIFATEYLVEYSVNKVQAVKDYNLAYYYYVSNEPQKALRTLQTLQTKKKKIKADVYALMSRIYFDTFDFEKSYDYAQKALKLNSKQSMATETIGDLKYKNGKYKNALTYYKKVSKAKNSQNITLKLYKTYENLEKYKKANEIMLKNLKSSNVVPEFYLQKAKFSENDKVIYTKKALSYDIMQKNAWYELIQERLKVKDNKTATEYLNNAYYIDENDFRYYYYQSLIKREEGQLDEAIKLLNKSNSLTPDFKFNKE